MTLIEWTASEARERTGSQNPEGMQQETDSTSALTQVEQLTADETNPTEGSGQSNPPLAQRECRSSRMTASSMIETAFLVPTAVFEEIWRSRNEWSTREAHSIILTIPVERRVATIALSIPRAGAIRLGRKFNLQTIFRSISS